MGRDQAAVRELRREGGRGIVNKEAKDPKVITSGRGEIEREENVREIDVHLKGYVPLAIGHIMHQRFFAVGNLSCAGFLVAVLAGAAALLVALAATLVALLAGSGAFAATAEGKLGGC